MSPLAILRRIVHPTGQHRAEPAEPSTPGPVLFRPEDAMANDVAWCPTEEQERLHAFLLLGGRICWTCRTVTLEPQK